MIHPDHAIYGGVNPLPAIPVCDHYAGSEKMILKALDIQQKRGPLFDITMDLEDGAQAGKESRLVEMACRLTLSDENRYGCTGIRIHDYTHPHWESDVRTILHLAGERVGYITIPKVTSPDHLNTMIETIKKISLSEGIKREIPIHVLIETQSALHWVERIASIKEVRCLDFGLMDFISDHYGAIPFSCMKSPGQFEHELVKRAKTRVVAHALHCGVVPAHNVTLDFKSYEQTLSDAKRAFQEFGFLRMWSIHPVQIDAILEANKPDADDVQRAVEILIRAQDEDWGPISFDGGLQDRGTYRGYWTLVKRAKQTGVFIGDAALRRWFS